MVHESLMMSKKQDWETPDHLFDALNQEFNFTLDVCAHSENHKLDNYYSPADDSLIQDWANDICFMNPPYGRDVYIWMEKAYNEYLKGATVVCLIAARTDTKYWHEFCMKATEIRLIKGRLRFKGADNSATFPSAIIVFDSRRYIESPILQSYLVTA